MIRRAIMLVVAIFLVAAPACAAENNALYAPVVSFFDLIANKQHYDGKLIQIAGYFSLTFEDSALYYSQTDYSHQFTQNAVWLDTTDRKDVNFSNYDQRYGNVVGIFSAKQCGHLCLYSGSLKFVRFGLMYKDVQRAGGNK